MKQVERAAIRDRGVANPMPENSQEPGAPREMIDV